MTDEFTPERAVKRLEAALAAGPLKLTASGGGITHELSLEQPDAVLVSRGDLALVLPALKERFAPPPDAGDAPVVVG